MSHDADWYSQVMTEDGSPAMAPLNESPWRELYLETAKLIDPHEEVCDLGCGTGRFIQQLYDRGHYAYVKGVDWALAPLEEALRYVQPPPKSEVDFELLDLEEWEPDPQRGGNRVFTCLETLEHLAGDLELVAKIPPGHRFIFSVPNYWSASHVRFFPSVGEVWDRYSSLLTFKRWIYVPIDEPTKMVHLVEGLRRSESWQ